MKFGQALSVMEAALPEELSAPLSGDARKLQDAAPAMPAATVHVIWPWNSGRAGGPPSSLEFDDVPAASASIRQVHRAVWRDGREVAVRCSTRSRSSPAE